MVFECPGAFAALRKQVVPARAGPRTLADKSRLRQTRIAVAVMPAGSLLSVLRAALTLCGAKVCGWMGMYIVYTVNRAGA